MPSTLGIFPPLPAAAYPMSPCDEVNGVDMFATCSCAMATHASTANYCSVNTKSGSTDFEAATLPPSHVLLPCSSLESCAYVLE